MKNKKKRIHFIGIGGVGMGGIAKVLSIMGYKITGSDIKKNEITNNLLKIGIQIHFRHHKKNIKEVDLIIISNAIPKDNQEVLAARENNIPIIKRIYIIAYLMRYHYGIAISGTHGKTTTTSILVHIFCSLNLDPTFINGTLTRKLEIHANYGYNKYLIAEIDESEPSFLSIKPDMIIITNIDRDHLNNYQNNFKKLNYCFYKFVSNLPFYGKAILCIDDPYIKKLMPKLNQDKIITYGFDRNANLYIHKYKQNGFFSEFSIKYENRIFKVNLKMLGKHNALNATAAIAAAIHEGIEPNKIVNTLKKFHGVLYRFYNFGKLKLLNINKRTSNTILISDYGHHPNEIQRSIETVRENWKNNRLIMIFQPHRYTRTKLLYYEFIKILSQVDILLILNIYSAGEKEIPQINSFNLCKSINKRNPLLKPILLHSLDSISLIIKRILNNNDVLLLQGAGTVHKAIRYLT